MHILFLAQHYAPEEVSGAVLATELASDLVARGHNVSFVTCAPNYPQGRIFPGYHNYPISREEIADVKVVRAWSFISPEKSTWPRVINYSTFSVSSLVGGLVVGKPDIIFSYSPPLPLGISAWLLSRFWKVPWILRVEDLYPEAAIAAGILRNKLLIHLFSELEYFLYQKASHISLISEGFRKKLLEKGVSEEKLSVTPVWADPDSILPLAKENSFRKKHGLVGRFIVLYAGNMGHASALEDAIEAADQLREYPDLYFVFVGEGVKKKDLQTTAMEKGLSNILFLPFQPREQFNEMLAAADMSLVTLNPNSFQSSLPSKTFNIMASSRPILSITPPESEIARLVKESNCGVNVSPGQPTVLANTILKVKEKRHLLVEMGENGRAQLEARFSRRVCVDSYENLLLNTLT